MQESDVFKMTQSIKRIFQSRRDVRLIALENKEDLKENEKWELVSWLIDIGEQVKDACLLFSTASLSRERQRFT